MISYAANREDVLLDRVFPRGVPGFYIDVGAYEPVQESVTKHFYDLGWRGINVEPAKGPFERLAGARDRDVNLNMGLSDEETTLTFYASEPESGWSTFSTEQVERHRQDGVPFTEHSVPVTTLAKVCEDYVDGTIDFLSVDVEGHEREVLAGGDWDKWRPRVVLVEATQPMTSIQNHHQWEKVLLDAGYEFAIFDGLNRYYVRNEDNHLLGPLSTPVSVLDEFVPYEFSKQLKDLQWHLESSARQLAATRAVNEALLAESQGFSQQVSYLHSEYQKLEDKYRELDAAYTAARTQSQVTRAILADSRDRYEQLRWEVAHVRAQAEAAHELFEGVGAGGMGVARRVTRVSHKFPRSGEMVKRSLRRALALRREAKRSLGRG
jgi:FkbM family methyltransferase